MRGSGAAPPSPRLGPRHAWRTALVAATLLRSVGEDGPLLDAGCGPGTTAVRLAEAGRTVLALDLARTRVSETRDRAAAAGVGERVLVFRADVMALPLRADSLAAAVSGEVLEHLADDGAAAVELARVLRAGGALVLTVPAGPGRMGALDRAIGHWRRYDRRGVSDLLVGAGLQVERLRGWGWPFGRLYDRLVQRPALAAGGGGLGRGLAWLGRQSAAAAIWRHAFGLDWRWDAGEQGSGWLAVGRKSVQ